jgi:hypothetical protein
MRIGGLTCISVVLLPHSLCRSTTANAPANRQCPYPRSLGGIQKNKEHLCFKYHIIKNQLMYTLENIQEELKSKERKVKDLIRYIKTRTDDNPNYSLLIGAGCSITSDIQSATSLIDIWKKEIYES